MTPPSSWRRDGSCRRPAIARRNASLDIAEGRAALDRGALDEAAQKFRHAVQAQPDSADAQQYLGSVLEKQGKADEAIAAYKKALELNPASTIAKARLEELTRPAASADDPARIAEVEGYIREGKFADAEPVLAAYVKERPASSWGWYALGYSLFAQQKIGESIKRAGEVARARRHQRRGAQDPRPRPDDHRPLRRRADRVRAGHPLQARFGGDALQPRQAAVDPGQLGAGAQGVRGGARASTRSTWRRWMRWASRWKRSATTRRAVANYQKAIALNDERHGTFALAAREPERLLQRDRRSGQGARARAAARSRSIRKSDGALFQQGARRRAPGRSRRRGQGAERRHRPQPARIVVLLRAGRRLSAARLDGREQEGAGGVHSGSSSESSRAGQEASRDGEPRRDSRGHMPIAWIARHRGARSCRRSGARGALPRSRGRAGTLGAARAGARRVHRRHRRGGPARAPSMSPAARPTSSSCSRRWAAASRSSTTTTTAGSTSSW